MKFTAEHVGVLERHSGVWETLKTAGFMRNIDRPAFDELQNVHNEALGPAQYTHWCPSCVADLVRILYTNYETWCNKTQGGLTEADKADIKQKFDASFSGRGPRKKSK